MTQILNAREIKEQVSLAELLRDLGYQPVKKSGAELMYKSMLRDNDTRPSLSVNDQLGVWFDHGTGKGGNIIDFALAYWPGLPFAEVLDKIRQSSVSLVPQQVPVKAHRPRIPVKMPHYVIKEVKPVRDGSPIAAYLAWRGVLEQGKDRLKEIHYFVEDGAGGRRNFCAAGWVNEMGGWEVRNRYFKGCLGRKAISFHPADEKKLVVFEGYFNYLSWLKAHPESGESVLVLNSTALLASAIAKSKEFSSIDLFLDNDVAGKTASREFLAALPYASDRAQIYAGYNDYNEMLQDQAAVAGIKR